MGSCCSGNDDIDGVYNDDPEGRGRGLYRIERRLGGGTFGEVYRVRNKENNKHFALKVVHKSRTQNPIERRAKKIAFLNETNILRELGRKKHPHILRHFHSFEDLKSYYIVTELCRGVSLFDRITACGTCKDGAYPFTERAAARITRHMVKAISYCHRMGIVHRDVKPENFLFQTTQANSPLKLIDFGEAMRLISEDQRIFNVAGSEYYLAPEVLPTDSESFRRTLKEWKGADLWSVGIVLYVCLYGRPPFVGRDAMQTFEKIRKGEYKLPRVSYVSKNACDFIKQILRKPQNRMSVGEALRHPFLTSDDARKDDPIPKTILRALTKFKKHCKLKRVVGRVLADQMTNNDKSTLQKVFRDFDRNGDGLLDMGELTDLMRSIQHLDGEGIRKFKSRKYIYGTTEAKEVLKATEVIKSPEDSLSDRERADSMDAITEEDFISMYAAHHYGRINNCEDELRAAFDSLDMDADGFVTAKDLHTSCGFMTPKTCEAIAKESADLKDGSGQISFPAFVRAMRNTPSYSNPPTPRIRSLLSSARQTPTAGTPVDSKRFTAQRALKGFEAPLLGQPALGPPQVGSSIGDQHHQPSGRSLVDQMKQPLLSAGGD